MRSGIPEALALKIENHIPVFDALPGVVVIHDLAEVSVIYMSRRGLNLLNMTMDEITSISSEEYFSWFFNEEDFRDANPKILGMLERNNNDEMITYFQQVRYQRRGNNWNWYMSSCKIFFRDDNGLPSHTITIAIPIDAMHHMTVKAERLLNENNFLRSNYQTFGKLTSREKEMLRLTALGKSAAEIAQELFIAVTTAETHRKNLKNKLGVNTQFELSQYARAFDLI